MPRISPETFRILEAEASSLQSLGKELEDGIMLVAERIRDFREAVEKFAKKVQAAKIGQRVQESTSAPGSETGAGVRVPGSSEREAPTAGVRATSPPAEMPGADTPEREA